MLIDDEDGEEGLLERTARQVEEERLGKGTVDSWATSIEHADASLSRPWLQGSTVEVLQRYIDFLGGGDDVGACISRMRLLAERLLEEADKLEAKGLENFHQSFDLH